MDVGPTSMDADIKELRERLSKLEGLAGKPAPGADGKSDDRSLLREHQEEMLTKLREIRAAMASESGDLDSVKAANDEVAQLREVIKRKDYRILHLTRALEDAATASATAEA